MALFDYFRSSYDLGEDFTETECQTVDIYPEEGGSLSFYWLDPSGQLWQTSYAGTHDFFPTTPEDGFRSRLKCCPNGKRGRVQPAYVTAYFNVTSSGSGKTMRLHMREGVLQDFVNNC